MKTVVTGVKACGKTTTIQLVQKHIPDIKVFVVGDYFEKVFKQRYGDKAQREMTEEIPRKEAIENQTKVAEMIVKEAKKAKHVLIDTNVLFIGKNGYYPGLPYFMLKILDPDVIAVLDVDPETILERRLRDEKIKSEVITEAGTVAKHRVRHAGKTIEEVELEEELQKKYAVACSELIGCSVKIIDLRFKEKEKFEHAKNAANEIIKMIKGD